VTPSYRGKPGELSLTAGVCVALVLSASAGVATSAAAPVPVAGSTTISRSAGPASVTDSPEWGRVWTLVRSTGLSSPRVVTTTHRTTVVWAQSRYVDGESSFRLSAMDLSAGGDPIPVTIARGQQLVSYSDDSKPQGLQVAADRAGNVTVVWADDRRSDGGSANHVVRAVHRPTRGEWSRPVNLLNTSPIAEPKLAVSPSGAAVVMWSVRGGVEVVHRPAGGDWQLPSQLRHTGLSFNRSIEIDNRGVGTYLYAKRRIIARRLIANGTRWTDETYLTRAGQLHNLGDVAVNGAGKAVAVWDHSWGGHATSKTRVESRQRQPGGSWQRMTPVSKGTRPSQDGPTLHPVVALDRRGRAAATWFEASGTWTHRVQVRRTARDGSWRRVRTLATDAIMNWDGPRLVSDRRGDVLVTWISRHDRRTRLQAAYRPLGGPWLSPKLVDRPIGPRYGGSWSSAVREGGEGAAIVWVTKNDRRIMLRELVASGSLREPEDSEPGR